MKPCIDFGHGGWDPGATFKGALEKDIVLDVGTKLVRILESWGWKPIRTRVGDEFLGLAERVRIANEHQCDIFLSIHTNADPDVDEPGMPEATGEEVWYYRSGKALAENIGIGLQRVFPGEPWRGIKQGNLHVTKYTHMPAALAEIAFIDASESSRRLSHPLERQEVALALALGLLRFQQQVTQGETFD